MDKLGFDFVLPCRATFVTFCELLLATCLFHARKANLRSMLHSTIRQAALGLLLMCSVPCHFSAQTIAVQQGMIAVCTFHNVTEEEVLDSPNLQSSLLGESGLSRAQAS